MKNDGTPTSMPSPWRLVKVSAMYMEVWYARERDHVIADSTQRRRNIAKGIRY
jgi:hypothetical protein